MFYKRIMKTINKCMEHVVRDFLQERENRDTVICNTNYNNVWQTAVAVCGIENRYIIWTISGRYYDQ